MAFPPIDDLTVGIVPGTVGELDGYRSVCESMAGETVTLAADPDDLASGPGDLLVVEGGERSREALEAADRTPPTLYIDSDPQAAVRAMAAGAEVFLHADRIDLLDDRLRSLHCGALDHDEGHAELPAHQSIEAGAYTTLMEDFSDQVYIFDRHARFVRVNRHKAAFHDLSPDDFVGKTDFDLFAPETATEVYADNMDVLEGRRAVEGKTEWIEDASGNAVHVTAVKHPIVDAEGRTIGLLGISRDITHLTRTRMAVADRARMIQHLYSIYDHNFRNVIQTRIGVQTQLRQAERTGGQLRDRLARLDRRLSGDRDGAGDLLAAAIEDWETVAAAIEAAGAVETSLIDDLERLVEDFGSLVGVVRTGGEITDVDVVAIADDAGEWTVTGPTLSVRTDRRAIRLFFEQLAAIAPRTATVTIERTTAGFSIDVPADVSLTEISTRYRDQDLLSGSTRLLKLRVLAEVMGWAIRERHSADGSVLAVDVDAWKRRAKAYDWPASSVRTID